MIHRIFLFSPICCCLSLVRRVRATSAFFDRIDISGRPIEGSPNEAAPFFLAIGSRPFGAGFSGGRIDRVFEAVPEGGGGERLPPDVASSVHGAGLRFMGKMPQSAQVLAWGEVDEPSAALKKKEHGQS